MFIASSYTIKANRLIRLDILLDDLPDESGAARAEAEAAVMTMGPSPLHEFGALASSDL